jgi:hypothetical protein
MGHRAPRLQLTRPKPTGGEVLVVIAHVTRPIERTYLNAGELAEMGGVGVRPPRLARVADGGCCPVVEIERDIEID